MTTTYREALQHLYRQGYDILEDNGQTQPLQDALAVMSGSEDEGPEVVSEYEADGVQVITELDEEGYRKTPPLARVYKDEAYLRK
ncbi:MAG: hypothetical protein C4551_02465 [Bacillota bacterium]|nr:MAG: hypothetical protein C4551_02465 [Bacillota bacterium]